MFWRRNEHPSKYEPTPPHAAPPTSTPAPSLGDECEAYLAGRYADVVDAVVGAGSRPAWVRLNEVAHAPLAALVEVAATPVGSASPWDAARRSLAEILIEASRDDEARARRLQLEILQPLESRLARVAEFVTPHRLVELVEVSLVGHGRRDRAA
jgi:hypothetical protein